MKLSVISEQKQEGSGVFAIAFATALVEIYYMGTFSRPHVNSDVSQVVSSFIRPCYYEQVEMLVSETDFSFPLTNQFT